MKRKCLLSIKCFGISFFCYVTALLLLTCNTPVQYSNEPSSVLLDNDTLIRLGDTLNVHVAVHGAEKNHEFFIWEIDNNNIDTTDLSFKQVMWRFPDTAKHRIIVSSYDANGSRSLADTMYVGIKYCRPAVKIEADTAVMANDSITFKAVGTDNDGTIDHFLWTVDLKDNYLLSTKTGSLRWIWDKTQTGSHIIYVKGVDNDGLESDIDSLVIKVHSDIPSVLLSVHDTVMNVHDTLYVHPIVSDTTGRIISFHWILDDKKIGSDIAGNIRLSWGVKELGRHLIKISVLNDDSMESDFDSLVVMVRSKIQPHVSLSIHDTTVRIHDTLNITPVLSSTDEKIIAYRWALDGRSIGNDTSSSIRLNWGTDGYGMHLLKMYVLDCDSMESDSDSMLIKVVPGKPYIFVPHDTMISSLDTFILKVQAVDSNGFIDRYLWKFGSKGWEDSTVEPYYEIFYRGDSVTNVTVAARDNDGLIAVGKIDISFNRPPQVYISSPISEETLWVSENASRTLEFKYTISDPDNDSLKTVINWGRTLQSLEHHYIGTENSVSVPLDSLGKYSWRLDVTDFWGNTVSKQGNVYIGKEHTICFAGHSIVAGMMSDYNNGGFRAGVLRVLRDSLGNFERLRSIGPLTDNFMNQYPQDDSSFALSGTVGRDMYFMLNYALPKLSADIWVLMMGANGHYTNEELNYTINLIDIMYSRNHNARIYVLNSLPFPNNDDNSIYNPNLVNTFNPGLKNTIADRAAKGYHISLIDAYSLMTKNNGEFDSTWFSDNVHPNQNGYDLLGGEILRIMRLSLPQAITRKEFTLDN